MSEIWKPIPSIEGYWASNQGRIKSKYRILKPKVTKNGYEEVNIRSRMYRVHRLVLMAFEGPSDLLGLHKNGRKRDNRLSNLYWGTLRDNALDRVEHRVGMGSTRKRPVVREDGEIFKSAKEAARHSGTTGSSIQRAIRENNKAGGYKWRYA